MDRLPDVEMLWESTNPTHELTERFGFDGVASAAAWLADLLDRHWGLSISDCDRLVISDRNVVAWIRVGRRALIAKWSARPERFTQLTEAAEVVAWLDGSAVPVAAPIRTRHGRLMVELPNDAGVRFLVGVVPVVEGELLSAGDPCQIEEAGHMLARLHRQLARYPGEITRGRRWQGQLIHNDFRSSNILHDGTGISAVLDFEEITIDTRVADLAKSAVLLATVYRNWAATTESVRAAYVSAYEAEADEPLTIAERREFDARVANVLQSFGWT